MRSNPLYTSPLVDLYRTIGLQRGASPAFINASIAQGISESSLNPNAVGDNGQARGLHQWHPDRYQSLLALSQKMNLPPTDPRVQINHWYDENKNNLGIADPRAANDAALGSERPAGWKPGDPTGVPSYDKRLGDTMALMRLTAGQSMGQDPSSFAATAGPNAPNPSEPISEQTLVPGQQENPLDNVGSSLVNLGAIVAGLDRKNPGMANALQGVASNMQRQQALQQRQKGYGVQMLDDNKGYLTINRETGEVVLKPLPAGMQTNETTAMEKDLAAAQSNPTLMKAFEHKYGLEKIEPSLSEDTRRMYAMRAIKGDNSWTREIGGDKQGNVDKRAIDEEITRVAGELKLTPDDLMKARTEQRYRSKVADRIAQIDVNTETASNKIEAAATNLLETSKKYPRGDIRVLESLRQKWDEQTNDPNLQALKTAVDAFALDYATALNPQKTSPTVDDVRNARNKILTTMNQESLEAAVGIVTREIQSIRQNARRTHEQWFGADEQAPSGRQPMIRDTEKAPSGTPSAPQIDPNKALEELRRRGKI